MAAAATKTCSTCFGEIDARAKKCPQCHSPIGVYKMAAGFVVFVCFWGTIGLFALIIWGTSGRSSYHQVDHPEDVKIVSSRHYFAPGSQNESAKTAAVVGLLQNDSDEALTHIDFEVRFYNAKDELIDTFDSTHSGTIQPHDEISFKLSDNANAHLPEAEYASHKIIVKHAYVDEELTRRARSNP